MASVVCSTGLAAAVPSPAGASTLTHVGLSYLADHEHSYMISGTSGGTDDCVADTCVITVTLERDGIVVAQKSAPVEKDYPGGSPAYGELVGECDKTPGAVNFFQLGVVERRTWWSPTYTEVKALGGVGKRFPCDGGSEVGDPTSIQCELKDQVMECWSKYVDLTHVVH
jgi:hypothetical protein